MNRISNHQTATISQQRATATTIYHHYYYHWMCDMIMATIGIISYNSWGCSEAEGLLVFAQVPTQTTSADRSSDNASLLRGRRAEPRENERTLLGKGFISYLLHHTSDRRRNYRSGNDWTKRGKPSRRRGHAHTPRIKNGIKRIICVSTESPMITDHWIATTLFWAAIYHETSSRELMALATLVERQLWWRMTSTG